MSEIILSIDWLAILKYIGFTAVLFFFFFIMFFKGPNY